jgi:tetratricopeptide (TPR) repeat protein
MADHSEVGALSVAPDVDEFIDGRFRLIDVAGRGASGIVYRAIDTKSARDVALKVFQRASTDFARFEREAEVLATLRHRHVVGYVSHGLREGGDPFLAMEWLEGVDLAERLTDGPLPLQDALILVMHAAQGLAAAHALGIVHRDVKPGNLFLLGRRAEDVRVIDFGIARAPQSFTRLTTTGSVLGTPSYMSPEQARGSSHLTPRSDVFSLGSVLFECLTGRLPFEGPSPNAILAQILAGSTPLLSQHMADMPPVLDALVARMLAHDPTDRLPDGTAVAKAVSGLLNNGSEGSAARLTEPLLSRARRAHSMLLIRGDDAPAAIDEIALRAAVHGGEARSQGTGIVVVEFSLRSRADAADRAARCALELRQLDQSFAMTITTTSLHTLAGEASAVEAALRLSGAPGLISLDVASAGYLDRDYDVGRSANQCTLVGFRPSHPLSMGALFGRERELALLAGTYAEVVANECPRIALVVGEAGIGKSRLIGELLRNLQTPATKPLILRAQGDRPTRTSPFAVLAQLVRSRFCKSGSQTAEESWTRMREQLHALGHKAVDVEFLRDLVGAQETDGATVHGVADRDDPVLMADGYRNAWLSFVETALEAGPLVAVVEDLHLADLASIRLLDVTVEQFPESAVLIVASARLDEASEVLGIFHGHEPERIHLKALRRRAAGSVVRSVLTDAEQTVVDRVIERAAGNPLGLAELSRISLNSGPLDQRTPAITNPSTSLVGAIETRVEQLESAVQRILRAGSVFGMQFSADGVGALLGHDHRLEEVSRGLGIAEKGQFVVLHSRGDFLSASFVSGLVQEAIYGSLGDDERPVVHGSVARWLETRPFIEPSLIAWHFERSSERHHAFRWYKAAARAALAGRDVEGAQQLVDQALACNPTGEDLARAMALRAEAAFLTGDTSLGKEAATAAMTAARPGSAGWVRAVGILITSMGQRGDNVELAKLAELVRAQPPESDAVDQRVICLCRAATQLFSAGERTIPRGILSECEAEAPVDLLAKAWIRRGLTAFHVADHNYDAATALMTDIIRLHSAAGDVRGSCQARILLASIHMFAGDFEAAGSELDVAEAIALRTGADYFAKWAAYTRGKVLAQLGAPEAARAHLAGVRRTLAGNPRIISGTHIYSAIAALRVGEAAWAEEEARAALAAHTAPATKAAALGTLARALVMAGRPQEALCAGQEALSILRDLASMEEHESEVHLGISEALSACGRHEEARHAARRASERLAMIAEKLANPVKRQNYLERIDTHARTLRLAMSLGV